tara:strand:- start:128 stop:337 length:210 start_codon:yes stop_codon:yes gene_type:complete
MTNIEKFWTALFILKPNVEATVHGDILTEDDFNNINWITGVNGDTAITTKSNPHSEITWTKLKTEMDKL